MKGRTLALLDLTPWLLGNLFGLPVEIIRYGKLGKGSRWVYAPRPHHRGYRPLIVVSLRRASFRLWTRRWQVSEGTRQDSVFEWLT
jgi:hypothetical protein